MAAGGLSDATQRLLLVKVGVEDTLDLDAAYKALTDEQEARFVEESQPFLAARKAS